MVKPIERQFKFAVRLLDTNPFVVMAIATLTNSAPLSLCWSPDKAGLLAATSFDQTLRVCLATNLPEKS